MRRSAEDYRAHRVGKQPAARRKAHLVAGVSLDALSAACALHPPRGDYVTITTTGTPGVTTYHTDRRGTS